MESSDLLWMALVIFVFALLSLGSGAIVAVLTNVTLGLINKMLAWQHKKTGPPSPPPSIDDDWKSILTWISAFVGTIMIFTLVATAHAVEFASIWMILLSSLMVVTAIYAAILAAVFIGCIVMQLAGRFG